jgi:hypothetical protein
VRGICNGKNNRSRIKEKLKKDLDNKIFEKLQKRRFDEFPVMCARKKKKTR